MHQTQTEDHVARKKVRNCDWCWEHITIGDAYRRYRFYDAGTAITIYMHPECYVAMTDMAREEGGWCEWTAGMERPEIAVEGEG